MPEDKFTVDNIVAIIESAKKGGSQKIICERAGGNILKGMLQYWLTKGGKDLKNENRTALAVFAERYYSVRPAQFRGPSEGYRMENIQNALGILDGTGTDPPPVKQTQQRRRGKGLGKCARCGGNMTHSRVINGSDPPTDVTICRQCGHEA